MKKFVIFLIFNLLFIMLLKAQKDFEYDKRIPFDAIKYVNNVPFAKIDDAWVQILSIADVDVSIYKAMAVNFNPIDWKKAFHRWVHYLFDELGIERDKFIKVSYLKDEKPVSKLIELKLKNRELATSFHDSIYKIRQLDRIPNVDITPGFLYLTQRIYGESEDDKYWISKDDAMADLNYLEFELTENYSYLELTGFNYLEALDAIRLSLNKGIDIRDFALQLKMLMANFGDGHSTIGFNSLGEFKSLPFRLVRNGDKFYAIDPDRKDYFLIDFPEIVSIDGIPMLQLFESAKKMVSKTTLDFVEKVSLAYLNKVELILKMHNVNVKDSVVVAFRNSELPKLETTKVKIGSHRLSNINITHTLFDSIVGDQIGYLALNQKMFRDDKLIDGLHNIMHSFKDTKSLIIDIRGNGGGSRDVLLNLMPYFISKPTVVNIAKFRINKSSNLLPSNGFLERRFMYPKSLSKDVFKAKHDSFIHGIDQFMKTFRPEVLVEDSLFSKYHYMVVFPNDEEGFFYDKKVMVLIDGNCFSASDIFAAAIQRAPNVELAGSRTGGGSGYADRKKLPFSNIRFRLSRMFSYQPNGLSYDGNGVLPDIILEPTLLDKIGQTDSQLEWSINYLNKSSK